MSDPDQTRRQAVAALLATINDVVAHGGLPSNIAIAQSAVDALAAHALAAAQHEMSKHLQTAAGLDEEGSSSRPSPASPATPPKPPLPPNVER